MMPVNKQAVLKLSSNDAILSFWITEFRVEQDALRRLAHHWGKFMNIRRPFGRPMCYFYDKFNPGQRRPKLRFHGRRIVMNAHWLLRYGILISRSPLLTASAGFPIGGSISPLQLPQASRSPQSMDYRDVAETHARLAQLDQASIYVDRVLIGHTSDYKSNPTNPKSFPIYALRISANALDSQEDNYQKNGILFECGMHAREWLGSESCLTLAEHLVAHRNDHASAVPELLSYVDV
jgi:hypothetical protein